MTSYRPQGTKRTLVFLTKEEIKYNLGQKKKNSLSNYFEGNSKSIEKFLEILQYVSNNFLILLPNVTFDGSELEKAPLLSLGEK